MTRYNDNQYGTDVTDESGGTGGDREARLDAVFGALSNARRRHVVAFFRDNDAEAVDLERLAGAVAQREGSAASDRLACSLRHTHVPKLVEAGVVTYGPDRSQVRYEAAPLVERLLDQT